MYQLHHGQMRNEEIWTVSFIAFFSQHHMTNGRIDDYSQHDNEQINRQNHSEGDSCFLVRTNEQNCRATDVSWVHTVYESFLEHCELQFQQTWIKRKSLLWEVWRGYLLNEPGDNCDLLFKLCEILHYFAPDLRQSFSKFASINDWSYPGEGLANDISRKCSFCSSQVNWFFACTLRPRESWYHLTRWASFT